MAEPAISSDHRSVLQRLRMDRAVALSIAGRLWGLGANLISILLVASEFPPELQGFHYTFLSLLALQVFAEMGLGTVVIANAGHEWSKLTVDDKGRVEGDPQAKSRLASLARFTFAWYVTAGTAAAALLALGGTLFFGSTQSSQVALWSTPWLALCVISGVNLCLVPGWVLLEGCNQVDNVYLFRLLQAIASGLAGWLAISFGAGLWTLPIAGLVSALLSAGFLCVRHGAFLKSLLLNSGRGPVLDWRHDILPMQWRIGLSWLSGYLAFSLFTPVLFHYQGAVLAGQMGMTWSIANAITSIASGWIVPKAPRWSMLIAKRSYFELDRQFWRLTTGVVFVSVVGGLLIYAGIIALNAFQHPFAHRLLPPAASAFLLLAILLHVASLPMSTYLRAHRKEPLLKISVAQGVCTAIMILGLGRHSSVETLTLGYLAILVVTLPWTALVWRRNRRAWQLQA